MRKMLMAKTVCDEFGDWEETGRERVNVRDKWTHNRGYHVAVNATQAKRVRQLLQDGYSPEDDVVSIRVADAGRCPCLDCTSNGSATGELVWERLSQ